MWHDRAVRVPRLLLVLFGVAGVVDVVGVWLDSPPLYLRAELVALLALTGYIIVAGRGHAARVRWPLLAALAVPTVAAAVELFTYRSEPPPDLTDLKRHFFVTSDPDPYVQMLRQLPHDALQALPLLALLVAAAVSVLALPVRRPRRVALVVGGLAGLATLPLAYLSYDAGRSSWLEWYDRPAVPTVGGLLFAAVPVTVLGAAVVALTVSSRRTWAATLGVALLVLPGLYLLGPAGFAGIHQQFYEPPRPPGTDYAVAVSVVQTGPAVSTELGLAVLRAFLLAGLALVVLGCLAVRRERPTDGG
jgi:hypothetical protein